MRKLIAILLMIALTMALAGCAGGDTEPMVTETLPQQAETTEQATTQTLPAQTESSVPATTQTEATEPATTQPKQTEPTEPAQLATTVTVYLLEKTVLYDNGYQVYIYDDNNNIVAVETYSLENILLYKTHFNKQDANGMFCQIVEEWDGDSQYRTLVWFQDGKLQEEQYDPGYSGDQYEYDLAGRISQMRNYYDGILNYTVHFEYDGDALERVYCENPEGAKLYECKIEDGRIVGRNAYDAEGTMYYSYEFHYDNNGNLEKSTFTMDGETSPDETHTYRAVEVAIDRAPYLIAQQQYLLDMYHIG